MALICDAAVAAGGASAASGAEAAKLAALRLAYLPPPGASERPASSGAVLAAILARLPEVVRAVPSSFSLRRQRLRAARARALMQSL